MAKKNTNKNISGLGYSSRDFVYPEHDPKVTPASFGIYATPENLSRATMTPTISGIPLGQVGLGASGTINTATTNPATIGMAAPTSGAPSQPASAFLSSAEQQPVKDYMANPQQLNAPSPVDMAKSWLSNLFDTKDTWDEGQYKSTGAVETVWDSMLTGLGWSYDRLNQVTVAGLSGLPGGTQTLAWDQAGEVSFGQQMIANAGVSAGKVKRGEGNIFDVGSLINPLGAIAMATPGDTATQQAGFDIANAEDRKVFDSGFEKFGSVSLDAAFNIFADPLIFAGKVAKFARIKYIDRPIDAKTLPEFINNVSTAAVTIAGGDPAQIAKLSPEGQFINWVSQKSEDGVKTITRSEIYNHRVIRYSTNREGLTAALYNSDNAAEAALVMRSAAGDATAQAEMLATRADLAVEIGDAQRKLNEMKYIFNPDVKQKMILNADRYVKQAEKRVKDLDEAGMKDTPLYQQALAQMDQAIETRAFTRDLNLSKIDPLAHPTQDTIDSAIKAVGEMRRRDSYFMKAYTDETTRVNSVWGSLRNSTRGFSKDNAFGRRVEANREARATAAYQASVTRGARVFDEATGKLRGGNPLTQGKRLHFWENDVFGNNGLTRALRLWRWMGEETPSGFVNTKSIGAQESAREVRAALNVINIYSGKSRTVEIAEEAWDEAAKKYVPVLDKNGVQKVKTYQVGGAEQKERLLGMYIDALNDSTRGDMAAKMALDEIEDRITNDIAAWHGLSKGTAQDVLRMSKNKRDQLVEQIRKTGYWIDETTGDVNQSPWLETHLQNGTYMLNFKAFEKRARLWDDSPYAKGADTLKQSIGDKASNAYDFFNELWRPAVLMRLGYTQRNVTEGLFRASAFQFSLDPLAYAAQQLAYGVRNAYVKRTYQGAVEQATVALREAEKTGSQVIFPKKFLEWRAKQMAAREMDIAGNLETLRAAGMVNAPYSVALHAEMSALFAKELKEVRDATSQLKTKGVSDGRLDVLVDQEKYIQNTLNDLKAIKPVDDASAITERAVSDWRYYQQVFDDSKFQRVVLDSDLNAVALFRQQGLAKRRVFDGSFSGPDHITFKQAFDADSPYTPIALMNSSADNTTRSMSALRMDTMDNALRSVKMRYNINVSMDNPTEYFDGLATALRQFKYSEVGRMVVNGDSPDEIVKFLQSTTEGREIAAFITKADVSKGNQVKFSLRDTDALDDYVDHLFARWQQLAPSQELRDYVRATDLGTLDEGMSLAGKKIQSGWNGKIVEQFLGQKDAAGKYVYDLKPVVGNIAEETGFKSIRQLLGNVTNTGMKWLGTIPENAFVRVPFYGKRYQQTFTDLVETLKQQQPGEYVSAKELDQIMRTAHRRALKDTKDWLYTIDRRTRLGAVGEYAFPFISAAQNSITTVGRIIWNDPSVAAVLNQIWNAPNNMGIEDENGNIVIPIPHDLIPDGVESALGLDNMENWKINKSALNVVAPETGFGLVPRPGPLVVAPVSEIMKHGWFGISVESPDIMRSVFGKEGADQIWGVWKAYTFGENQGISKEFLSLDFFQPPIAAKILQMIQGEGSSSSYAYYYNVQLRTEVAKYAAGLRDDYPKPEEIKAKTNGLYMLRILGNLTAFTPPQYESKIDPLINTIRMYEKNYGRDAARMASENLGNVLYMIGNFSNSKNKGGMMPTADSVESARKYSDLIGKIAPQLQQSGDLSVLSMLVNNDPNAFYDDSAYAWQFSNKIPGTTDYFRELQTPEMAMVESQKNAGWTAYISMMDQLDSLLQQRGLSSYRSPAASDLREMKYQAVEKMRKNPMYAGWYNDFKDFGSVRTVNAISTMEIALSDPQFIEDNKDSPIWQAASFYLAQRKIVMDALASSSSRSINNTANQQIQDYWDAQRAMLVNQVTGWSTFANRFLNGDDDPQAPGTQFGVTYVDVNGGTNGNAA